MAPGQRSHRFRPLAHLAGPGPVRQPPDDCRTSFCYHYYEHPGRHSVRRHYGVVTDRYKLFYFYEPDADYWTLINRQPDPREFTNQYENPAYAQTVKQLHAELDRLRAEFRGPAEDPPGSFRRPRRGAQRKGT